ncbi:MAG: D-beta-hydroxybutyrate dehydrogenase [Planctomycetota bacterium]|nr:MAG: D-beta-hydroxybutyrate dehydrogenase [Planctomycetota bacterium]
MKKSILVTGGASGIGKSVALEFAKNDYDVIISDINEQDGSDLAQAENISFYPCDLSDAKAVKELSNKCLEQFTKIDILVNNAGFQHISPIDEFPEDMWEKMIHVLLTAPFLLTKYFFPEMKNQKWGRIINVGSVHSQVASPYKAAYISAKHGLVGLTKTTAIEGGPYNITANVICPAYVQTPLVDKQIQAQAKTRGIKEEEVIKEVFLKNSVNNEIIQPDEVSDLIFYLASDKAKSITGSCLNIDSGWIAQ